MRRVTDRRTEGRTDGRTRRCRKDRAMHSVAGVKSTLKTLSENRE